MAHDRPEGTPSGRCITEINDGGPASLDELLTNLRDGIRADLDLPPMPGERWWLRISGNETES